MVETANVYLTEHAYLRMKERLGLNKSAADKLAKRAWERGLYGDCVKGRLSTYLFSKSETAVEQAIRFLYGEHIFVFLPCAEEVRLVTVFRLDSEYKNQAICAQRKARLRKAC